MPHFSGQNKRSRKQGKSTSKSKKSIGSIVEKEGRYALQHDVVKATVSLKKVKESEVFDKPNKGKKKDNKKTNPKK
tara:strand:- start:297 stop:524 length:228 start_codon:yes stop_codon:yes gene_type:complete